MNCAQMICNFFPVYGREFYVFKEIVARSFQLMMLHWWFSVRTGTLNIHTGQHAVLDGFAINSGAYMLFTAYDLLVFLCCF